MKMWKHTSVWISMVLLSVFVTAAVAGASWKKKLNKEDIRFDESFDLGRSGVLDIEVDDVNIRLQHGDEARVTLYVSARHDDDAEEYFDRLRFRAELDDKTLSVTTRNHSRRWGWGHDHFKNVKVDMVITVPKGTRIQASTSDGDVWAEELEGNIRIRSSDGDVVIGRIKGDEISLRSSDGDIRVKSIEGKHVSVVTSDGDVNVTSIKADDASFKSSDGDVIIKKAEARFLEMRTSDGDISVDADCERLKARTSDGSIYLKLLSSMEVELTTSDGDIEMDAPADLKARLNLRGARVRVHGAIDIRGEMSKRRVVGDIGGGGPEISARTSDGQISLDLR